MRTPLSILVLILAPSTLLAFDCSKKDDAPATTATATGAATGTNGVTINGANGNVVVDDQNVGSRGVATVTPGKVVVPGVATVTGGKVVTPGATVTGDKVVVPGGATVDKNKEVVFGMGTLTVPH